MSCLFPGCENTKHFCKDTEIKFFKFPALPYIRQKWLTACNLNESQLPKVPHICSLHFGKKDIVVGNKCKLNINAIPANECLPTHTSDANSSFKDNEDYMEIYNRDNENQSGVSRKVVRKSFTSIATQTDVSLEDYRINNSLADIEIRNLKQKIAITKT